MTRWQHLLAAIRFPRSEIVVVVVRPERMAPAEVDKGLRSLPESAPFYKAVMQLLDETRDEALANIPECATMQAMDALAMAVHSGGAKYLKAVREEIVRRRLKKTSNVQRSTSNVQ